MQTHANKNEWKFTACDTNATKQLVVRHAGTLGWLFRTCVCEENIKFVLFPSWKCYLTCVRTTSVFNLQWSCFWQRNHALCSYPAKHTHTPKHTCDVRPLALIQGDSYRKELFVSECHLIALLPLSLLKVGSECVRVCACVCCHGNIMAGRGVRLAVFRLMKMIKTEISCTEFILIKHPTPSQCVTAHYAAALHPAEHP